MTPAERHARKQIVRLGVDCEIALQIASRPETADRWRAQMRESAERLSRTAFLHARRLPQQQAVTP